MTSNKQDSFESSQNDDLQGIQVKAYDSVLTFVQLVDENLYNEYSTRPESRENCVNRMNQLYLKLVGLLGEQKKLQEDISSEQREIQSKNYEKECVLHQECDSLKNEISELKKNATKMKQSILENGVTQTPEHILNYEEDDDESDFLENDPEVIEEREALADFIEELGECDGVVKGLNERALKLEDTIKDVELEGIDQDTQYKDLETKKDFLEEELQGKVENQKEIESIERSQKEELEQVKDCQFDCEDNKNSIKMQEEGIIRNLNNLMSKSEITICKYKELLMVKDELEKEMMDTDEVMNNLRDENKGLEFEVYQMDRIIEEINEQMALNEKLREKYNYFKMKFFEKEENIVSADDELQHCGQSVQTNPKFVNTQGYSSCLECPQLKLDESFKIKIELEDFGSKPDQIESTNMHNHQTISQSIHGSQIMKSKFKSAEHLRSGPDYREGSEEDDQVKINFGKNETTINGKNIGNIVQQNQPYSNYYNHGNNGPVYKGNNGSYPSPNSWGQNTHAQMAYTGYGVPYNNMNSVSHSFGSTAKFNNITNHEYSREFSMNDIMNDLSEENRLIIERLERNALELSDQIRLESKKQEFYLISEVESQKIDAGLDQRNSNLEEVKKGKELMINAPSLPNEITDIYGHIDGVVVSPQNINSQEPANIYNSNYNSNHNRNHQGLLMNNSGNLHRSETEDTSANEFSKKDTDFSTLLNNKSPRVGVKRGMYLDNNLSLPLKTL